MSPRRKRKTFKEVALEMAWPAAQMAGLIFFAWLNASHFDQTELKMLGEFAAYWKILSIVQDKVS